MEVRVYNRHVGQFGQLGRVCQTTRWLDESPLISFIFMGFDDFGSVTFGEKPELAECTRRLVESLL